MSTKTERESNERRVLRSALSALDIARDAIQPLSKAQITLHRFNPETDRILDEAAAEVMAALSAHRAEPPRPSDDALWDQTLQERDNYQEWADKLAAEISRFIDLDIGEHSSANNPWARAIDMVPAGTLTEALERAAEPPRTVTGDGAILTAAQAFLDAVDTRHESEIPLKYTVPYGAMNDLRNAVAQALKGQAAEPPAHNDHPLQHWDRTCPACAAEPGAAALTDELVAAAHAVVARWDTPLWKDAPFTSDFIDRLRKALAVLAASQPAPQEAPTDAMVPVTKNDANNYYCLILTALGMKEEGDPVAEVERLMASQPGAAASPFYIGGPYDDGSFSVCDLLTGRVLRQFKTEVDLLGPQRYRWSHVGMERYRVMAASVDDANADFVAAEPSAAALTDELVDRLRKLLDAAGGEGFELGGVDAGDLFIELFENDGPFAMRLAVSQPSTGMGNPNIRYRFAVGDLVQHKDGKFGAVTVKRLCYSDESYELSNGWTSPGYNLLSADASRL